MLVLNQNFKKVIVMLQELADSKSLDLEELFVLVKDKISEPLEHNLTKLIYEANEDDQLLEDIIDLLQNEK